MAFQSSRSQNESCLSKPLPCAQCGHGLSAPTWSEELGEQRVRYLWSCRACGYEFETTVFFAHSVPKAA